MSQTSQLQGKVAIVTGGSRGIGFAVASALVDRGASVMIGARSAQRVAAACERLRATERPVDGAVADVRDHAQARALMDRTAERFGGLDVLVNNAGLGRFASVADQPPEHWSEMIETNLTGVFHCCREAIPLMRRRGGGAIVNISSLAGKNPFVGGAGYCASKAGLNAFSEALMEEVRHDGIRVSYVMPGSVATEFNGQDPSAGAEWKIAAADVAQVVVDLLALDPRSLSSRVELRPSRPPQKELPR